MISVNSLPVSDTTFVVSYDVIIFVNELDPDQARQNVLIWIQTVRQPGGNPDLF